MENLSPRYKTFLGFIALIFVCNLLLVNDLIQPYFSAEKTNLVRAGWDLDSPKIFLEREMFSLPSLLHCMVPQNLFLVRLIGSIVLVLSLFGGFFLGKRVLGESRMLRSTLVVMTSLLVVNVAKFALLDVWAFGVQIGLFFSLILYLKQATRKWRDLYYAFLFLGLLTAPIQSLTFGIGYWIYLYFLHPKGKTLAAMKPWFIWLPLLSMALYLQNPLHSLAWEAPLRFLSLTGLGMLLFWAFLIPALWHLLIRLPKREEFSILLFGGILFGMLTLSLSVQYFFAILIAKQFADFFNKNYPYESVVKAIAILSMITAFCMAMYGMMAAFQTHGNVGFRSIMQLSLAYWMPNFVFIIGLYGKNRNMTEFGILTAGVLLTFMFWMRVAPLVLPTWF